MCVSFAKLNSQNTQLLEYAYVVVVEDIEDCLTKYLLAR